jgi:hypothetical protein
MTGVALVHLVWAPLGTPPLERFLAALDRIEAGVDFRLVVLMNGFRAPGEAAAHRAVLRRRQADEIWLPRREQDLGAYGVAIGLVEARMLVFANSYAEPLADGWLSMLCEQAARPDVGMAGATGSFESAWSAAPRPLKPLKALGFPRFPNPHLRTNALAVEQRLARDLRWWRPRTKTSALLLESGRRGLSRQVRARSLRTVVVGRDGAALDPSDWPGSRTFRSGDQERLLVADNRTRQYEDAGPAERRRLAAMAWG